MQTGGSSSLMDGIESPSARGQRGGGSAVSASRDPKAIAMAVGGAIIFIVAIVLIVRAVGSVTAGVGDGSRIRVAIDSETGKVFKEFRIKDGETWPWKHPSTGRATLYPTEECYWTADGQAKLEPTHVLLNSIIGKDEKTICPDCGREVVAHNPMPPTDLLLKAAESFKR